MVSLTVWCTVTIKGRTLLSGNNFVDSVFVLRGTISMISKFDEGVPLF